MSIISPKCLDIIQNLCSSVDEANYKLIDNMTDLNQVDWVCVRPDVSYEYFFSLLKKSWEEIINKFINQPNKCDTFFETVLSLYQYATPERLSEAKLFLEKFSDPSKKIGLDDIDNIILEVVANSLLEPPEKDFVITCNFMESSKSLMIIMVENCQCQLAEIFKTFIKKYKKRYYGKIRDKSKEQVVELLRDDYHKFKTILKKFGYGKMDGVRENLFNDMADKLVGLHSFSIGTELDKLIPKDLGSLKEFFIIIITKYYENLHPIVWAQIFKNMVENLFVDLPFTPGEIFAFFSKYLLLNSGPFILKILQMIRPLLTDELAEKYNLVELKNPLLKQDQVKLILNKVIYNWPMYKILQNFSASVGHVCKVVRIDKPFNIFIIKIIKPIAIAQSCWEYQTLYNIFPKGSCEQAFTVNMLESIGKELNIKNEMENINVGFESYTGNYSDIFSIDINANLTTVQNIHGIVKPNCWFVLAMTLAPGIPLSKLVEKNLVQNDTMYRAKLHRCLDILVFKFFSNLIKSGYYHGDLHSGNIFFSYEDSLMTLIDFGSVGEINIYTSNPDIQIIIDVVIMSIFYNFDTMFDTLTKLLNTKCSEDKIDMNSKGYAELKRTLYEHKIKNVKNWKSERERSEIYSKDIFGEKRIHDEKNGKSGKEKSEKMEKSETEIDLQNSVEHINSPFVNRLILHSTHPSTRSSIYSDLDKNLVEGCYKESIKNEMDTVLIENRDVLPQFTEIVGNGESINFAGIMELIIKFYAMNGVNVAIKFSELSSIQKAYALLLGVLSRVYYNSYRLGIVINKAILSWKNIAELRHLESVAHITKVYFREKGIFDKLMKEVLATSVEERIEDIEVSGNRVATQLMTHTVNDDFLKNLMITK